MAEETYTIEVTGEQARLLAGWLSMLAQDAEGASEKHREELKKLVPVGEQCAAIATEAGEWSEK